MCGIFGHTGFVEGTIEASRAALHTLAHRGPSGWKDAVVSGTDAEGVAAEAGVYLGHRRLSILDLSENGAQPMQSGGVYLTVNGEIYNFQALREELKTKHGAPFHSHSDSEVLLQGYIHWGMDELLERVDGMFALALYDSNLGKVFLARDHAGIKPLYYGFDGAVLSWASELKALEAFYGKENLVVDNTALYDFLTYLYIPHPKTMYQNIFKLKPGHVAVFDVAAKQLDVRAYWQLEVKPNHQRSTEQAKADTKAAIERAVGEQLVADVPVGFFLSGGVDSSLVCYEGAQRMRETQHEMMTCSISFEDPAVDETRYAQAVADVIHSTHKTRRVTHAQINADAGRMKELFDEPFGDTSAFPTLEVCKLASEHVVVVLTGDGGDELFGGYSSYAHPLYYLTPWTGVLAPVRPLIAWLKNNGRGKLQSWARKLEVLTLTDPLEKRARLSGGLIRSDKAKQTWAKKLGIPADYDDYWHTRQFYRTDLPLRTRGQYMDVHTYMHELVLTKVDRTSMAVSIETRVPLLSKHVMTHAFSLTEKQRYLGGELKGILKDIYKAFLPEFVLFRKKQGFSAGAASEGDVMHRAADVSYPEHLLSRFFGITLTDGAK